MYITQNDQLRLYTQGCPIGIPKNPEISGSRKNSLSAAEEVHSARRKYCGESKVGGWGGGSSRTQYEKICRFVQKSFFIRRMPRSRKCMGGVVAEPSEKKSVDFFVRRLK